MSRTQKDRILGILRGCSAISNYELRALDPPIFQYPVRIKELRDEGHNIVTRHDEKDSRRWWYSLVREVIEEPAVIREDLFKTF